MQWVQQGHRQINTACEYHVAAKTDNSGFQSHFSPESHREKSDSLDML